MLFHNRSFSLELCTLFSLRLHFAFFCVKKARDCVIPSHPCSYIINVQLFLKCFLVHCAHFYVLKRFALFLALHSSPARALSVQDESFLHVHKMQIFRGQKIRNLRQKQNTRFVRPRKLEAYNLLCGNTNKMESIPKNTNHPIIELKPIADPIISIIL